MSEEQPQFPDYGDNGDTAGVRRARRSFRLIVVAFVAIAASLWISERFLRHTGAERNYISALTQEQDSARVFLLQAMKEDRADRNKPTAKYTQALAVRSEHDVILRRYQEGVLLDPDNTLFRVRYGCRLYLMNQTDQAAQQFAQAAGQRSVLPLYLEAAAVAEGRGGSRQALSEALAKVATANSRNEPLVFPRPLWSTEFEQKGYWYAELSRGIADEVCALLYRLSQVVTEDVARQIDQNQLQNARIWTTEILHMGERLSAESEPAGAAQAIAGITIQLQAIEILDKLGSPMNGTTEEELIEKRLKLEQALAAVSAFETERQSGIDEQLRKHQQPLKMVLAAPGLLILVHLLGLILYRVFRFKKSRWTVPHSTLGQWVLAGGSLTFLLLLSAVSILQSVPESSLLTVQAIGFAWNGLVLLLILFGLIYPGLTLKSVEEVSRKSSRLEDMEQTIRAARHTYRRAYASLAVRYYGILSGVTTCAVCAWAIGFRILTGLYPWQFKLLASGLLEAEREAVKLALGMLG